MTNQPRAASAASECIRALNDQFRKSLSGGSLVLTIGVIQRGREFQRRAIDLVRKYDAFTPDNDPFGEQDFGAFEIGGTRLFFKIDYYNRALDGHSPDPADASVTHRVLTLMLAEEY